MEYKEKIKATIDYIESNLKERIMLENLAKQAYISKYHYHRVFHELVGETVMSYIRKRRLAEAAKELVESDSKIIDIAFKYQFGSQEAFSRAFRKIYNVTPGEYRRQNTSVLHRNKISLRNNKTWHSDPICKAA